MKKLLSTILFLVAFISLVVFSANAFAAPPAKDSRYFQLKIYHYSSGEQEALIDKYLQSRFIPALHTSGLSNIGVFKAIGNDTAADKKMYIFIPFSSLRQWEKYSLESANKEKTAIGSDEYMNAASDKPAFTRIENIFLKAFELMPAITPSKLTGPKSERVYELRSYESASEKLYRNKVKMFNQGGEINIFSRLGFNAVFYSEVIFGSKMPNLMYMTSFENMQSREDHWKAFSDDPAWKTLSALPEYQKNVSHSDIYFLRPTEYSEL
jgi:hypothetical protein